MKSFFRTVVVVSILVFMLAGQGMYAVSDAASPLSGKVVETMNSGGYTYVCLLKDGKKTWVAVPEMKVAKGQNISFQSGAEMVDFRSKTLNRIFDRIIFSAGPAN